MTNNESIEKNNKKKDLDQDDDFDLIYALLLDFASTNPSSPEEEQEENASTGYDFSFESDRLSYRSSLNAGIADVVNEMRGIKYEFGGKAKSGISLKDCAGIDCSGFVAVAVGEAFRQAGVSEKFIRKMRTSSQGQLNFMKKLGVEISREGQLSVETIKGRVPMFVAMDTGKTRFDSGRVDGIDHVALIYEKDGALMVAQSSGSKGVNDAMPLEKWLKRWDRKGAKLYATDLAEAAMSAKTLENNPGQSPSATARAEIKDNKTGFVDGAPSLKPSQLEHNNNLTLDSQ